MSAGATFRFYAELNDLLSPERRMASFEVPADGRSTVKDTIESLGVPHTEVDLILVNGESVDFSARVRGGDRVSVYPVFESFDISRVARVRPAPLRETRFILEFISAGSPHTCAWRASMRSIKTIPLTTNWRGFRARSIVFC